MRPVCIAMPALMFAILACPVFPHVSVGAQEQAPAGKKTAEKKAEKPAKDGGKTAEKDIMKQWADLLARREKISSAIDKLAGDFEAADNEGKKKLRSTYEKLQAEFQDEVAPGLNQLAAAVRKKDPTDPIAAQIAIGKLLPRQEGQTVPDENYSEIVTIVKGLTRTDKDSKLLVENIIGILLQDWRSSEVIAIADRLVDAKDANPRILLLDAMAWHRLGEFDKATELAKRAAKLPSASPESAQFVKTCEESVESWKNEQEIRAKEAEADDLPRVLFKTSKGDITLELFENEAPNTVANFLSLVEAKKYDGVKFHRVIPGFMAQGGDPNTLDDDPSNDGQGGPGYTIACECYSDKARKHFPGSLSMAHSGKDTGGSQFFLTHSTTSHLDRVQGKEGSNHTVFGRIVKGLDVALALRIGDTIESATVIRKRDHDYVPKKVAEKPAGGKGQKANGKKKSNDE